MGVNRRAKGDEIEAFAAQYVRDLGYTILGRNFTIRGGEIDIIALDGEELVFIEVRFRETDDAEWTITPRKVEALRRAATRYLEELPERREFRFDLLAISSASVRHTKHFIA